MHWYYGWGMGGMWLWWILVIGLVVIGVVFACRGPRQRSAHPLESPEQILKRRFASGEIDRPTYEQMLGDLKK